MKPRLLDLFCGAGGCSMGYHRAGFEIVGVDIEPQPNYPFSFVLGDALEFLTEHPRFVAGFDAIHASPPCQHYSRTHAIKGTKEQHPDLVDATRAALEKTGKPWAIENVPEARLRNPCVLCGLTFGLRVIRHRQFESSFPLVAPPHRPHPKDLTTGTMSAKRGGSGNGYSTGSAGLVCVAGKNFNRAAGAAAMGIDWPMNQAELAQAIPPAYTEHVGKQLIDHLLATSPLLISSLGGSAREAMRRSA
jgi:DNA (cytosine-5)-methyltransferase 1